MKEENKAVSTHTSYGHVLKFTGVFGGVQGLKLFVSLIRNKLSSYLLGTTGFGLLAVYSSVTEFITHLCNCGIPINTTQKVSELYEDGTSQQMKDFVCIVRTWVVWTALVAALLSISLSPVLSFLFFDEWGRWPEVMLLTPVVVAFLVAEGECSLLKGMRQLRSVAIVESIVAVSTLLSTIPFYYFWGLSGIIGALVLSTSLSSVVHLFFSIRLVPYRIRPFSREVLVHGWPFIRRGLPYVVSGIATSLATLSVPVIILASGSMDDVGLYKAGFALMAGYAGMAFVALEADYYPRLSSTHHHPERMNLCINQQIEVCVLIIAPLLLLLSLFLPQVVRLQYTGDFLAVLPMATCATFYTFFRAIMLPVAYIPLAKGDSLIYLAVELAYNLMFCLLMWAGWTFGGLTGVGVALSAAALYDVLVVVVLYHRRYGCRIGTPTMRLILVQLVMLSVSVVFCLQSNVLFRYVVGGFLFLSSASYSLLMLRNRMR